MSTDQTPDKAELEAEIAELRQSVGDTVDALSRRLDVKTRAKDKVLSVPPSVAAGVGAVLVVGVGIWVWRRRG